MSNQGISLISLIITIIVIIILAAIVIFSGLGTPDSAQFSNFCQDCDNVYSAVMNKFADLKVDHALSGDYRTDEQIYIEIATGEDPKQYAVMDNNAVAKGDASSGIAGAGASKGVQLIESGDSKRMINLVLPTVRQSNNAWYVTKDGQVFNATGYFYDGKTYFNAAIHHDGELPATDTTEQDRSVAIGKALMEDKSVVTGLEGK